MKYSEVPKEVREDRKRARQLAREAGIKIRFTGDGLFVVEGQDHLMSAWQIIELLDDQSGD